MPSHIILQELDSLDKSLPQFPGQLTNFLSGERYKERIPEFQDGDSTWLIEYLDNVGGCVVLCLPPAEPAKVFDMLDPTGSASRTCLRELGRICGTRGRLPQSHILDAYPFDLVVRPVVHGRNVEEDRWNGLLNGSKVCVKGPGKLLSEEREVLYLHKLSPFSTHTVDKPTRQFTATSSSGNV